MPSRVLMLLSRRTNNGSESFIMEQACRAHVHDVGTVRLVTVSQASCVSSVGVAIYRVASFAGMVKAKARWPSRMQLV